MRKSLFFLVLSLQMFNFLVAGIRKVELMESRRTPIKIYGSERIPTMIKFPEKVFRVFLGSPTSWTIRAIDKEVVVRPREKISTGLIVELKNGRSIPIRLIPVIKEKADDIVYIIFPRDFIQIAPLPPRNPSHMTGTFRDKKDTEKNKWEKWGAFKFSYKWKDSKRIKIKTVFDDGISTYIVYRNDSAIGAVYLKSPGAKSSEIEVVNFVVRENVCRIDRRLNYGERFVVVYGKEKVEIKRG